MRSLALLLFAPALLSAQDTTESPTPAPFRVCASGDITLGTNLDTAWTRLGARRLRTQWGLSDAPAELIAPLRPLFADADLLILNVETAIGTGPAHTKCGPKSKNCYAFRSPPSAAEAIRSLGREDAIVIGNVANNHARDAGNENVATTVRHLARARVLATGHDSMATPVVLRGGVTVGVLGFYTGNYPTDALDLAQVRRLTERAVEMYGTVIVTAHIGAEGIGAQRTRDSTEMFLEKIDRGNPVAFATAAFDGGATMVIGHGPHVLRAAEWRDDRLAIYSLGNLITYGPFNNAEPLNRGAVFCADVLGRSVIGADLRATVQRAPGVVGRDPTNRAYTLIDSLSVLDFPNSGARVNAWGELLRVGPTVLDTASSASSPSRARGGRASAGGSARTAAGPRS